MTRQLLFVTANDRQRVSHASGAGSEAGARERACGGVRGAQPLGES